MNLNTLTDFPYTKRYYLIHPWAWVKELYRNIRNAWMRATKGYCYTDVWNWDSWFCSAVPPMLRHMADHGSAYPGVEPFETPEKWYSWLYEMAECIERLQYDDWIDDNNEYSKEYHQSFEDEIYEEEHTNGPHVTFSNKLPREEIRKLYYERCKELNEVRQQVLKDLGCELFSHFDKLWD